MASRRPPSSSSSSSSAPTPGNRPLKVGENVRHALMQIFQRGEVHDPDLAKYNVTVTEVRMSPDLRHATAFVTPLGGKDMEGMLKELKRCAPLLRMEVARAVKMRYATELHFQPDTSFDYAEKITRLLQTPDIAEGLKKKSDDEA